MAWSEADVPDQTGRVALVTGANSGIGFETARALASRGAHVVLACRDRARADDAVFRIGPVAGPTEVLDLDLADLDQVRAAVDQLRERHDRLDLLVNNAGVMATPHRRTAQGFELQLGVNHLGHFALTGLVLDLLTGTEGSRVVTVSSQAHRIGRIRFDDLQSEASYSAWAAYGQAKLANLLFAFELQRRLVALGAPTTSSAAHPGAASTNLGGEPSGLLGRALSVARPVLDRFLAQSAAAGALPTLRAATDPDAGGGSYWGPSGLGEQQGHPVEVGCTDRARDEVAAARLWAVSELLTGVRYPGSP